MSKFNKACSVVAENLDNSNMGTIEFAWKGVKDEEHKKALLSILKDGFLFNGSHDKLFAKAQKHPINASNPHKSLLRSSRTSQRERKIIQDGDDITLKIEGIPLDPAVKQISEEFMHALSIDIQYGMERIVNWNPKLYPNGRPKCWKFTSKLRGKYADLTNRVPELEGVFESVELNPEFHMMKEEERAIEEIAEAVQKLFQDYEERIVALMANLKRSRLELQDQKLNKYIGITHLRNDLRLSIGKICKKHFHSLENGITRHPVYTQYERIFEKPLLGITGIRTEGGIMLKYEDDVFEVIFDTYDYTIGERITNTKSIETFEIKDYLKKLLETWLNVIITHRQYYFTEEYLKIRKEKTKYRPLTNRVPELEGIFESTSEEPSYILELTFNLLNQNDKYMLLKVLKWRKEVLDANKSNPQIVDQGNSLKFITGAIFVDRTLNEIEVSCQRMLRISMDYIYPNMKNQSADEFIDRIFKSANVSYKKKNLYDTEKRIPELEGIFESENQILDKYNLIDPLKLKSADDFKELWMGYKFPDESYVDKVFELFSLFPKHKLDEYQISLKRIEDPKQVVLVVKSNPEQLRQIKRDVEISEIGDTLANQIRGEIYKLHYDYDIRDRSDEEIMYFNDLHWRFQGECYFLGIRTRWSELNDRLPELKGLFESPSSADDVVDVSLEIDRTDREGNKTTQPIVEVIAKYLRSQTYINMKETWACSIEPRFDYTIKDNPPKIIFTNIPKSIAKTYLMELKESIFFADRYIGDALGEDYSYYLSSLLFKNIKIDESSVKLRQLTKRIPELEGIFEDARAHSGPDVMFQHVYATFKPIKDESLLNEFEKCLNELKSTLEKEEGFGRANLANRECEIQKNQNEFTFVVKRVPFTKTEADPKQLHHVENNLNRIFWECLWSVLRTNNCPARDWLRSNLQMKKYAWKNSQLEELEQRLPELKGIFD